MTNRGFTIYVDQTPRTGFTEYAEKLNGRLAMIGFISLRALEVLTGHALIGWLTNL
ncbi:MAG: high light inducible protein [Nostoc sp.]|uniref:high light inducible protein n=1 Tax=unclassified Nostoc TaxID=2593658 RepID=UPI0025DDB22C|nr:high light inducible protein [Nostoc sp. NMS7]